MTSTVEMKIDHTHTIVEMLDLHGQLDHIRHVRQTTFRFPKYAKHRPSLATMQNEMTLHIVRLAKKLPLRDLQHFMFAATHVFYKLSYVRRAFNKMLYVE